MGCCQSITSSPAQGETPKRTVSCRSCGGVGHNKKTCEKLPKIRCKPPETKWMTEEARKRLEEGPTQEDGPGWIYIYTKSNINTSGKKEANNLFKIGRSKGPPEQRIRAQENANNEDYDIMFSIQTPFHKLAETVIHRQLQDFRTPREVGDGKTEWFTGTAGHFENTVKRVVRVMHAINVVVVDSSTVEE